MSLLNLIRFAFTRLGRRRQEQSVVDRFAKGEGRLNVAAQVRDDDLLIHDGTVRGDPGSIRPESKIDNPIRESECGRPLINERAERR
jgi:hypothetical protein